jgi:hypothetical protein
MPFGRYYLIKNFWQLIVMGLIACVAMAFGGEYIRVFFVLGRLSREVSYKHCDVLLLMLISGLNLLRSNT